MNYLKIVFSFLFIYSGQLQSSPTIIFNMTPSGYPPVMTNELGEDPTGIMFEVLNEIASRKGHQITIKTLPRKRVGIDLISEKVDAISRAKEWTTNTELFLFADIVIEVRDVNFSLKNNPIKFESIEDLYKKTIFTHLGYKYPMLDQGFKDN
ncbi:MAG: hypothetical protein V7785_13915 [Bermanella sp.]